MKKSVSKGDRKPKGRGDPELRDRPSHKIRLRRLLVPTDFSDASKQALPLAVPLAKQFSAQIDLVHVVAPVLPADVTNLIPPIAPQDLAREAGANLEGFRKREMPPTLPVSTRVLIGDAAYELTRFAKTQGVDLIVVSTHGYTGLKHLLMGSTAERVVRHAPCPVLVVRTTTTTKAQKQNRFDLKRILVPTDFSSNANKALTYALTLAKQFGASVSLLHVITLPTLPEYGYAHTALNAAAARQAAHERLEVMRRNLGDGPTLLKSARVRTGNPFQEIAEEAADENADLIVISTHGHSGIARFFLGGTAEKIVRYAPCPVLVVREREREFISD